jgi:L-threonylcarbamoyladenylate synthase
MIKTAMDSQLLIQAVTAAQRGDLIVYPTDTQYALGCTINNPTTIQRLYQLKQRPLNLALPIAVSSVIDISSVAHITPQQNHIAQTFLPGPLTMVLKRQSIISNLITASHETVAVRIPAHHQTIHLLKKTGPLVITSANIHGQKPYQDIADIQQLFKDEVAVYLPGGILNKPPSTIIDFTTTPPTLLRPGPISLQDIIDVI